jgi:lipopolysaccharide export system protein LptC
MTATRRLDRLITWSPVLLLGGLAALTYWLDAQIQPTVPRPDGSKRHDVDLYVDSVRAINFGADGKPLQVLAAARAEHYPDDDSTVLVKPDLEIKDPREPNFEIRADMAKVSGDRDDVWFTGAVHARRDAEPAQKASPPPADAVSPVGATTLATDYLHVRPREKLADTDKAVTVEDARGTVNAVGMKLDANNGSVRFLSRVRGTIAPSAVQAK